MVDDVPANEPSAASSQRVTWLRRLIRRVGQLAALCTLALGLPTLGASAAAFAWPLELLSHFRVQYAIALLILAAVLMILRWFGWATVAVVLFALNAWHVAPYVLPMGGTVTNSERAPLKLVSINVYSGNRTPERVIEFLRKVNPDVIVVLEVTPEWERRLSELSPKYPHSAVQSRSDNFGIALYSRIPLKECEFIALSEQNHAISARLSVDGEQVTVIAAHPFPPVGARASDLRSRQLEQLAKHVTSVRNPAVVAGDLNITPFSPYFNEFLAAAKLTDSRRGQGLFTTWPAHRLLLRIPIDHCLVSGRLTARLAIGPDVGSDHLPVIAEIGLPKKDAKPRSR